MVWGSWRSYKQGVAATTKPPPLSEEEEERSAGRMREQAKVNIYRASCQRAHPPKVPVICLRSGYVRDAPIYGCRSMLPDADTQFKDV